VTHATAPIVKSLNQGVAATPDLTMHDRERRSRVLAAIPVLWLCGAGGAGKTTAGWDIFSALGAAGTQAAYVDIDQLGMCYPETPSDPGRYRLKTLNLADLVRNYQLAGARCVVVSGVTDPARGVDRDLLPHTDLTICLLRASPGDIRQRLTARGASAEAIEESVREAGELDASDFADVCIDTSGLPAAEVLRLVRDRCAAWPALPTRRGPDLAGHEPPAESGISAPVLLVCGPTGVGKSTVGFQVYLRTLQAGFTSAYIDLDQIGFILPATAGDPRKHRLKAANLASARQNFSRAGAQRLVLVGPIEDAQAAAAYSRALPSAKSELVRLHAGPSELIRRITMRGQGLGSWPQPGDPLIGQSADRLAAIADKAAAQAATLEHADFDAVRIDTDGCTVEQAADAIMAETGWPGLSS
jgi:adenylylsulfate kinase-like enzyme